jgi:hypothetical protein
MPLHPKEIYLQEMQIKYLYKIESFMACTLHPVMKEYSFWGKNVQQRIKLCTCLHASFYVVIVYNDIKARVYREMNAL